MTNCIPKQDTRLCINCGKLCRTENRNCSASPDLAPAAEKLGVPFESIGRYAQIVAQWQAAGCQELAPEQAAARKAECETCEFNGEACGSKASGCGGTVHRPPLKVMQQIPTCRCPEKKPGWVVTHPAETPDQLSPVAASGV
jgi:hypothetical protein